MGNLTLCTYSLYSFVASRITLVNHVVFYCIIMLLLLDCRLTRFRLWPFIIHFLMYTFAQLYRFIHYYFSWPLRVARWFIQLVLLPPHSHRDGFNVSLRVASRCYAALFLRVLLPPVALQYHLTLQRGRGRSLFVFYFFYFCVS